MHHLNQTASRDVEQRRFSVVPLFRIGSRAKSPLVWCLLAVFLWQAVCFAAALADAPIVILVHAENADRRDETARQKEAHRRIEMLRSRIESLSGLACQIVPAARIERHDLSRDTVQAIIVAARPFPQQGNSSEQIVRLIRDAKKPLLVVGAGVEQLRSVYDDALAGETPPPDESSVSESNEASDTGWMQPFVTVRARSVDPLFAGLPETMLMPGDKGDDDAGDEANNSANPTGSLPDNLVLLADSPDGAVRAVKHKTLPIYGVQFCPERHNYARADGRMMLTNFFRIAGVDIARTVPLYLQTLQAEAREGLDGLHETPEQLRLVDHPVVCGVDMENPVVIRKRMENPAGERWSDRLSRFRARMRELSGVPCMVVHYTQISHEDFANPGLKAIIVMGQSGQTVEPLSWEISSVIRDTDKPLLGICRGHQLIGETFGSTVARMRLLRPGEKDANPSYTPGYFKETGFVTVHVRSSDTLFDGHGDAPVFRQSHSAEVKQLPPGFTLLAGTSECAIQAMKHDRRILYGVQFHPESYDDEHLDGKKLLGNFFRIAGLGARAGSD